MSIKINIHPSLYHLTNNQADIKVSGNNVGQCLDDLVRQFPDIKPELFGKKGKLLNHVEIYINLESAYPDELTKPVKDRDELHIVMMLTGG